MTTQEDIVLIGFILFVSFIMVMLNLAGRSEGYKKGQVDALNGKIEFVLVEFKDGTRAYYKRSELKHLIEHKIVDDFQPVKRENKTVSI